MSLRLVLLIHAADLTAAIRPFMAIGPTEGEKDDELIKDDEVVSEDTPLVYKYKCKWLWQNIFSICKFDFLFCLLVFEIFIVLKL